MVVQFGVGWDISQTVVAESKQKYTGGVEITGSSYNHGYFDFQRMEIHPSQDNNDPNWK